ncbi:hypothetical protein ACF0H5_004880 [Mactra antiquata]
MANKNKKKRNRSSGSENLNTSKIFKPRGPSESSEGSGVENSVIVSEILNETNTVLYESFNEESGSNVGETGTRTQSNNAPTANTKKAESSNPFNSDIMNLLQHQDIFYYEQLGCVMIAGDFNARVAKKERKSGNLRHWRMLDDLIHHGSNIALNKSVSHTPATYLKDKYKATLAADGNCNTTFSEAPSYTCTLTNMNNGTSPTWTVILDKLHQITGIVIYNRINYTRRARLGNFTVFGACDGQENVVLYNDTEHKKYHLEVIQLEINGTRECSNISVQIPQKTDVDYQYLTLCEVQVYAAVCSKPTHSSFAVFVPNKTTYTKNESLNFQCKTGYRPSQSTTTVTCCGVDTFCPTNPICERVYCQLPGQPANGQYNTSTSTNTSLEYGTVIYGKCNIGYKEGISDTTRRCQQNGTWSGQDLVCTQITCNPPPSVQNGYYSYTNKSKYDNVTEPYNTNLTGYCNVGYNLTKPSSITCGYNSSWVGDLPICNIVTCDPPVKTENGSYVYKNTTVYSWTSEIYNTKLLGRCNIGFKLKSSSELSCSQYGNWSGTLAVCKHITCEWPGLENGNYIGITEPFYYNYTLTPKCNKGYNLENNNKIVCNENGEWSYKTAVCGTENNDSPSMAMIVGIAVAVVVCVVLAVVMFILIRRRKNNSAVKNTETKPKHYVAGEYANVLETRFAITATPRDNTNRGIYENSTLNLQRDVEDKTAVNYESSKTYYSFQSDKNIPLTAIKLENLSDIILKGDTAQAQFREQFEKLPSGMVEAHLAGREGNNIGKNRYKNLCAYDHSRVVLQKDQPDQSDYINACYVDGYSRQNAYIASQGPTKNTLEDFWRMLWQTNCNKIVMLTNLIEEGKPKCVQYWPADKEEIFGDVVVTLEKTESFSAFVIRNLSVKKNNMEPKKITQFHFTAWPDKSVPKYASSLVQFRHKVTCARTAKKGPIVVHCSAGIGRTGTFVALDFLTEQAKNVGYVDVFSAVKAMRRQRVNFVQTLEQYTFLHHALVETLMLSTSALPSRKFPEWYKSLLHIDETTKKRKLDVEFETLSRLSPTADEWQYCAAKLVRNRSKNRYSNVLPMEEFMPRLEQLDDTNSDTTYINAVYLPSYKQKDAFIITQTPLVETKQDFWRLVWEYNIHLIIMMNSIEETTDGEEYWPDDGATITSGNLVIIHKSTLQDKHHKTVKMQVKNKLITRNVVQVQFGGWKMYEKLPKTKDSILSLYETIQSLQRTVGDQPLLVHCMNGVDKSGLYCVISAVLERMKIEQDVAITQMIEEMRKAREQIIPKVEQYEFCHQVVLSYIEEFSTYSNFSL